MKEPIETDAVFSPCRTWRYQLRRLWGREGRLCMFIGLNPSTADEVKNDPTVRRCLGFAQDWGHDGLLMANIFAIRSTDPNGIKCVEDPVGPENDEWLIKMAEKAAVVVAAWGTHGAYLDRGREVYRLLSREMKDPIWCLGTTKHGFPKHPLYLRKTLTLGYFRC